MPQCKIRSYVAQTGKVDQKWFHVDATDQILGRLATKIATVLMGKHKPTYTAHVDTGDFVVVTNAQKIRVTGNKAKTMSYARYSYHPGGYAEDSFEHVMEHHPDRIIRESVRRMLPKNKLGGAMLRKLKVYTTDTHPHAAQCPEPFDF